jgi:hypothetical protein
MRILNRLDASYETRCIAQLRKQFPQTSEAAIRTDYEQATYNPTTFFARVRSGKLDLEYAAQTLNLAQESPKRRVSRFMTKALHSLFS